MSLLSNPLRRPILLFTLASHLNSTIQFNQARSCAGAASRGGEGPEANTRGVGFTVMPVEAGLAVEADRQVLALVLGNLLQNAFKYTRPHTTVTLRVDATADRVRIEIEDACGGFPDGDIKKLFRPFEQRSADRSGLGLGLAFSRWGAEANHGHIDTRNLPGRGCIFTVDLPRLAAPAVVSV